MVHGLRETASKQRCCTRLTCRSLTAVCARLTLRARAPMLVAHRRRREKMAPGMCAPMAVRSSPCDPSSCTDLISSQTTFYLSQTRAESLVLTWSIFSTAPVTDASGQNANKLNAKCIARQRIHDQERELVVEDPGLHLTFLMPARQRAHGPHTQRHNAYRLTRTLSRASQR